MRIVFDATMVKPEQGGIGTYATGLARSLAGLPDTQLVVLLPQSNSDDWGDASTFRTKLTRLDPYSRTAWRQLHVPALARRFRADALLVPAPEPVALGSIPQAMIVHDLGPLLAPRVYGRRRRLHFAATLRRSLARVDLVFTPSIVTKLDVLRWSGLDPRHIVVAGPDLVRAPTTESSGAATSDFALYVGTMLPHKNVDVLVDCFVNGGEHVSGMPAGLVIVGPEHGDEVRRTMQRAGGSDAVEHRGFVSEQELDSLYSSARVVLFPSLFEGFGLPLIEAMARGTPVVASDIPALREVGGEDVTYVRDPTDHEQWRAAIAAAAQRPALTAGFVTWDGCAQKVRSSLEALLRDSAVPRHRR